MSTTIRTFEDFGAVGNADPSTGSGADDTGPIQDALDWAFNSGGAIRMTARNFLCSNITTYPYTTIIGTGRHTSAFVAKEGTTGKWWTDNGNAAKTTMSGFSMYARDQPDMTAILDLGNTTTQFGTEGTLSSLFLRDAVNGDGLNVNGNVGIFRDITVWCCRRGVRILGNSNMVQGLVCQGAGERTTGAITGGPADIIGVDLSGCMVSQMEIEATVSGGLPLKINGDCRISQYVISSAPSTSFSHLIEVDTTSYNEWSLFDPVMFGTVTVTNGVLKVGGVYQGGTSSADFSGKSIVASLNVHGGNLALMEQSYQAFQVRIVNDGGTLKHRIGSLGDSGVPGTYCTKIVGSSVAFTATPTGAASFSAGASLQANGGTLVLDTAKPQDPASQTALAALQYNSTSIDLVVFAGVTDYTVGGVLGTRLAIEVRKTDGSAFNLTTMASGTFVQIGVVGYLV